ASGQIRQAGMVATAKAWRLADPWGETAAVVLLLPVLLSIALWNGFPLIFYDTGAYVLPGLAGVSLEERSPVYSLFVAASGGGLSLWLVGLAQAAMTTFVLAETARVLVPRLRVWVLLAIVAVL